ncbi:MAG: Druantia anti-phage system protein DruA [Sedimenticola sp.]
MPNTPQPIMYQGDREIAPQEIAHICTVLKRFPGLSRKEMVYTLCETLEWLTPAGLPKVDACTKLLHRLEEDGTVQLPPLQKDKRRSGACRQKPPRPHVEIEAQPPLIMPLKALDPIQLIPLVDKRAKDLCNAYIQRYHYLGYKRPFGYRQRYFIEAGSHRLGCILLSGPAKALAARDRWIGWDDRQRLKHLPWVLNNSRFLLFPWVRVANLASHVLGQLARRVGDDWEVRWGYRPVLLETFVDPVHFHGGCYRAAGWKLLGRTTGKGLTRPGKQYQTSQKLIFAKSLQTDFRHLLCSDQLKGRTEL